MLYLLFMAIVCAIAVGQPDAAGAEPAHATAYVLLLTCVYSSMPVLFAAFAVRLCRKGIQSPASFVAKSTWLLRAHGLMWITTALTIVYSARWPEAVRATFLSSTVLVDELVIVLPLFTSWVTSWMVFYAWYRDQQPPIGRRRFVWNQCRLTLLLAWLPVLLFCAIHDSLSALFPQLEPTRISMAVFVIDLGVLIVFFPRMLGWIWATTTLEHGPLRARLLGLAQAHGLRVRHIYIWQTDGRIANAAVAGVFPSTRRIFLSDLLLDHFTDDEIEATFAHELGHALHHHALFRMALLLVPVSLWLLLSTLFSVDQLFQGHDVSIPVLFGISAYLVLALGWYSRRLEHEADLWACQRLAARHGNAAALQRYVGVLFRMCDERHLHRGTWLHPGHKSRKKFLIRCLSNMKRAESFQREMKWIAALLTATALLPVVLLVAG